MVKMDVDIEEMFNTEEDSICATQQNTLTNTTSSDMKRNSDANMSLPQKRSRPGADDPELRLLIPSKVAGSIIGKGGMNISRLRNTYNASVTVPDCPGPERIVTICANYETAVKIVEEIIPNLEDYFRNVMRGKGDELDIKLLVHQSQAGCVIGKGGVKVKDLREKTGARIKIFSICCPQSTDRVVAVAGTGPVCLSAIKEIIDLIKVTPIKSYNEQYNPHNYDEEYAEEYGGYGMMSSGGRNMRDISGSGGNRRSGLPGMPPMRFPSPRDRLIQMPRALRGAGGGGGGSGGGSGGGAGGGNGPGFGAPQQSGRGGFLESGNRREEMMMGSGGSVGSSMVGNGNPSSRNLASGPPSFNTTQVTIPKDLAGAIIGKAGSRISKIRSESGAGITIDEPLPGSSDRIITITGLPNQIQMAQYLLQQSVHESMGNRY